MEYVAAMDFEIDQVLPVRDPQTFSLFSIEEDLISEISEKDYDFFMDDVNREMTDVTVLTELGPLPFLIRRSSNKRNSEKVSEKENYLSDHPTLHKSYSIPRMNSSERWNNFLGSIQGNNEALKALELTRSSSLRNFSDLIKISNADVTKDYCRSRDSHFSQNSSLVKNAAKISEKLQLSQATETGSNQATRLYHEYLQEVTSSYEEPQRHQIVEEVIAENEGNSQLLRLEQPTYLRIDGKSVHDCDHENSELTASSTEDENQMVETRTPSFCGDSCAIDPSQTKDVVGNKPNGPKETLSITPSNCVLTKQVVQPHVIESSNKESIKNIDEMTDTFTDDKMEASESLQIEKAPRLQDQCISSSREYSKLVTKNSSIAPILEKATAALSSRHSAQQVNVSSPNESSGSNKDKKVPFKTEKRRVETDSHEKDSSEIFSNKSCKGCHTGCASINRPKSLKDEGMPSIMCSPEFNKVTRGLPVPRKTLMITRKETQMLRRELLNRSVRYTSQRKVQLFKAAEEGDLAVVRKLLNPTLSEIRDGKKNNTLLHTAAARNQVDVIIHLLDLISPNVINRDGQTPAHVAAANGHTQILRILSFNRQFNPNKRDKKQRTFRDLLIAPVFKAVLAGDKKKVNTCLKLGADFDGHAGKLVNGVLTRELKISTPKQLATVVHGEQFLNYVTKGIHQNLTTMVYTKKCHRKPLP
ncbi:uncharacterized protein [Palaemon carinicauda]|uniref:uncharacterized protein n=1 Tax=Palaemon carinicauda TaxID=392227 RepID=UPI0035B58ADB